MPWPKIDATKTIAPSVQDEQPAKIDRDAQSEFVRRRRPAAEAFFQELASRFGEIPDDEKIR